MLKDQDTLLQFIIPDVNFCRQPLCLFLKNPFPRNRAGEPLLPGDAYGRRCSLPRLACERDGAAGLFYRGLANGEAEAGAAGSAGTRGIAAVEAVEDVRQGCPVDAVAMVLHREFDGVAPRGDLHFDCACGGLCWSAFISRLETRSMQSSAASGTMHGVAGRSRTTIY